MLCCHVCCLPPLLSAFQKDAEAKATRRFPKVSLRSDLRCVKASLPKTQRVCLGGACTGSYIVDVGSLQSAGEPCTATVQPLLCVVYVLAHVSWLTKQQRTTAFFE